MALSELPAPPASNCSFSTPALYEKLGRVCGPYISALEACPANSVTPGQRLEAANQTASCSQQLWGSAFDNLDPYDADPVFIDVNNTCSYPDFLPIMRKTCVFDLGRNDEICANGSMSLDTRAITTCQTEAAIQYVRCTIQKQPDEIEPCVVETAVRVDWLPKIHYYTGASKCAGPNTWIITQVGHILRAIVTALFIAQFFPPPRMVVKKLVVSPRGGGSGIKMQDMNRLREEAIFQNPNNQYQCSPTIDPYWNRSGMGYNYPIYPRYQYTGNLNPYDGMPAYHHPNQAMQQAEPPPDEHIGYVEGRIWALDAISVAQTVVTELLTAYLTVYILNKSNYFGQGDLILEIVFFAIRPRPAFFYGLMGLSPRWTRRGVADMGFDLWISFFGGGYLTVEYWHHYTSPANPMAPTDKLKYLSVGSVMMILPSVLFMVATILAAFIMLLRACGFWGVRARKGHTVSGCLFWMFCFISINFLLAFILFIAILEVIARSTMTIRGTKKDDSKDTEPTDWLEKLVWDPCWGKYIATTRSGFVFIYWLMIAMTIVTHIGSWMVFVTYLKLAGELFCPTKVAEIVPMWILLPFGIDVLFSSFRHWTRDTYGSS